MSTNVDWFDARKTQIEVLEPGDDWVGADEQRDDEYVLTFSVDDVAAVHGTPAALRKFAERLQAAVKQLP